MVPVIIILLVLIGAAAALSTQSLRVVREYQRLVVFRLGKAIALRGPGANILIPFVDKPVSVDLREAFIEVPHQTCITKDNVPISIDFLVYRRIIDPMASVVQVNNFAGASQGIAATTLRAVIGDIPLDDVLARRETINEVLRTRLDEVTERWGVKVTAVEIREILPPRDVQDAMNRQMSAERTRRAAVTEAEGKRQAIISVAEGEKQAQILRAEGKRQSSILEAEGTAQALSTVYVAASQIDSKTMTLQAIDGLKAIGAGPGSTFVIPMEFTKLFSQLNDHIGRSMNTGSPASQPELAAATEAPTDGVPTPAS